MELKLSPEDAAFQQEVRSFLQGAVPKDIQRKIELGLNLDKQDYVTWHKILYEKGWITPNWPVDQGGTDWTPLQRHIFEEEKAWAMTPRVIPFGVQMVAPVIMAFGSEEQKAKYLPDIRSGDVWWCQGYSEPGSGSDLASLKTKAVSDGDHYVVNGQKTWTTLAQHADMMFCLVRTDDSGKRQEGITFLLIDMTSPGIEVRPITTIDGGQEINDVFLDDVRVPKENRIGEEGQGWTIAKFLLGHERVGIAAVGTVQAAAGQGARDRRQRAIRRPAADRAGPFPRESGGDRDRPAGAGIGGPQGAGGRGRRQRAGARILVAQDQGHGGPAGDHRAVVRGGRQLRAPVRAGGIGPRWNEEPIGPTTRRPWRRPTSTGARPSIYGGTNEIQKNIIAKMVLGF